MMVMENHDFVSRCWGVKTCTKVFSENLSMAYGRFEVWGGRVYQRYP